MLVSLEVPRISSAVTPCVKCPKTGVNGILAFARQVQAPERTGVIEKFQFRERFYNYHRPHGAFAGKIPDEALRERLA